MKTNNEKLAEYMLTYIESTSAIKHHFMHHKQKYLIKDLLVTLLYKLEHKISYREISHTRIKNIQQVKSGALQYFNDKLVKLNFFNNFFNYYISKYIDEMDDKLSIFYVDSTLIANKLGIDEVTFNVQLKKHRSSKISIVIDNFGVPIDHITINSNVHDAPLCVNHINNIAKKYPKLCDNTKIFVADAAYDSKQIVESLKTNKLGTIVWFA
jgi:hypothetical protein